jgi:UPF0148 protein
LNTPLAVHATHRGWAEDDIIDTKTILFTYNQVCQGGLKLPEESKGIKTMADMLKRGATLTERSCPACSSPLFKLKSGDLWCFQCQKRVIVVKEGETPSEATTPVLLSSLESTILMKIQEIEKEIREEKDSEKLQKLGSSLSTLFENLERIRKMKRTQKS